MNKNKVISIEKKSSSIPIKDEKFFIKMAEKKIEQEKELNKLLKECIKEWCENTTSHGFSNMVKTDSWILRSIWIFLVLVFMAYCFYSVIISILSYLEFSTNINSKVLLDTPTLYPAVTICNLNTFDTTTESTTGTYIIKKLKENKISPNIKINSEVYGISEVLKAASILKASVTGDKNLTNDDLKKLGFTIDNMLISCFYNNEPCSKSEFVWFRDHEFGNCYTFNSLYDSNNTEKDPRTTTRPGPISALNLELFLGVPTHEYYTVKKGFRVAIHERGMRPLLKYEGINIGPGTATSIGILKTNFSKLDYPFSNCRKNTEKILDTDSTYFKNTIKISKYSQKLCFEICTQYMFIVPTCNCADPSVPIVDFNQTICSNIDEQRCLENQTNYFDQLNVNDYCGEHCPLECDSVLYSTSVSTVTYPSSYYMSILKSQESIKNRFSQKNTFDPSSSTSNINKRSININLGSISNNITNLTTVTNQNNQTNQTNQTNIQYNLNSTSALQNSSNQQGSSSSIVISDSDILGSFLMLSVYYEDLRYTFIEENPAITIDTLIGVIGGQFGLFMGASFLSFVEVVEMIVNIVRASLKYRKLRKSIKSINNFT